MKSSRIRMAVILGALSIVFIISFQVYWVYNTFDVKESQFNQRVSMGLLNVADRIAEFNGSQTPDHSPVIQMSSSYYIVDVNESIDPVVLEHFLKSEFNTRHIHLDFEYAIYDCETDRMVYGQYIAYKEGKTGEPSELNFRKVDDLAYYFGVFFPTKTTYILQSMNLWIISFLLILTALGFFIYAIFIILRQKRLSEIQKDFINNMTHEFKTPISSIAISAEVLQEDGIVQDQERFKRYAKVIADQNSKLEDHVERILHSATRDRHQMELKIESLDLCKIFQEVMRTIEGRVGSQQQLTLECKEVPAIQADRMHLTNMLLNLIDNALKYGGPAAKVKVICHVKDAVVLLRVEDDGPGIEPKYHRRIFNRFFRIPTKDISPVKGFGLGLHYVKFVVKSHGWKIKLESNTGKGSRFIIIMS